MPERRGIKEEPTRKEQTARERVARMSALERLRTSPDFWVLADFLSAALTSNERLLRKRITTTTEQAEHNFTLGVLAGLDYALRGTEIIEQSEQPPLANQK